jgi:hypothetical protein
VIVFGHSLDAVGGVFISSTRPPFGTSPGRTVRVGGAAFLKLTISGLTRSTDNVPDDMKASAPSRSASVAFPIVEMRRSQKPRSASPIVGPGAESTETWIIGLDHPACLTVTTMRLEGYGNTDPGDNAVVVDFG